MSDRQAMGRILVDLQLTPRNQACRPARRDIDQRSGVTVAVDEQHRHVDLPQVAAEVDLGEDTVKVEHHLQAAPLIFHPRGLRPFILNWEEVAARLIQRLQREAAANPADTRTGALLEELLGYPGVSSRWRTPDLDRPPTPLLSICYQRDAQAYRFFSTIATFGTAQDITLQELRIECFFPADETTRTAITRLKECHSP